jgi:hypothetical protein
MTVKLSTFSSYHNSIMFRDGTMLYVENISMGSEDLKVSGLVYR